MKYQAAAALFVGLLFIGSVVGVSGGPTEVDVPFNKNTTDQRGNVTYSFDHNGSGQLILYGNGTERGDKITRTRTGNSDFSFDYLQRDPTVTFYGDTQRLTATEGDFDGTIPNYTISQTSSSDVYVDNGRLVGYEVNETVQGNAGEISIEDGRTVNLSVYGAGEKRGSYITKGTFSDSDEDQRTLSFDKSQNNESIIFTGNKTTIIINETRTQSFDGSTPYDSKNVEQSNGKLQLGTTGTDYYYPLKYNDNFEDTSVGTMPSNWNVVVNDGDGNAEVQSEDKFGDDHIFRLTQAEGAGTSLQVRSTTADMSGADQNMTLLTYVKLEDLGADFQGASIKVQEGNGGEFSVRLPGTRDGNGNFQQFSINGTTGSSQSSWDQDHIYGIKVRMYTNGTVKGGIWDVSDGQTFRGSGGWEVVTTYTPTSGGNLYVSVNGAGGGDRLTQEFEHFWIYHGLGNNQELVMDGFEDYQTGRAPGNWTVVSQNGLTNTDGDVETTRAYSGSQSWEFTEDVGDSGGIGVIATEDLSDVQQPPDFSWKYFETSNNENAALRFLDESGNEVLVVGTDNPQVYYDCGGGKSLLKQTPSPDYNEWRQFNISFDYANDQITIEWKDLTGSTADQTTTCSFSASDIDEVQVVSDNQNGNAGSGGLDVWLDDITSFLDEKSTTTTADNGYWVDEYTTDKNAQDALLNWSHSETEGSIQYYVRTDSNTWVEWADVDEDTWKDLTDGEPVYVRVELNRSSGTGPTVDTYNVEWSNTTTAVTKDPAIDVNGDGTMEASYSGMLNDSESVTVDVTENISDGTHTFTVFLTEGVVDWKYRGNNDGRTYVSSVNISGETKASPDKFIGQNSVYTTTTDLTAGTHDVEVQVTDAGETQTIDKTTLVEPNRDGVATWERTYTSPTEIHDLTVSANDSANVSQDITTSGDSFTVNLTVPVGSQVNALDYQTETYVENPSLDVDDDGSPEAQYEGFLKEDQTKTRSLPDLEADTSHTFDVSSGSSLPVQWEYRGYNESRVFVESARIGNKTVAVNQYLGDGTTISEPVNISEGNKTFGVVTDGATTPRERVSELEVTGGYPAYRGIFVNPSNSISHQIEGEKNIVWEYGRSFDIAEDISQDVTVQTDGRAANFTPLSTIQEDSSIVARFRVGMDNGTFHFSRHNVEPDEKFVVYQDGIATSTVTSSPSGTIHWTKTDRWSTSHVVRIERVDNPEQIVNRTTERIIAPTGCNGQEVPYIGCVGDTKLFLASGAGSALGLIVGFGRWYTEYK